MCLSRLLIGIAQSLTWQGYRGHCGSRRRRLSADEGSLGSGLLSPLCRFVFQRIAHLFSSSKLCKGNLVLNKSSILLSHDDSLTVVLCKLSLCQVEKSSKVLMANICQIGPFILSKLSIKAGC